MSSSNRFRAAAAAALLAGTASAYADITYTDLYTLAVPAEGFTRITPNAPGNQVAAGGQIVGLSDNTSTGGSYHALLWNGAPAPIDLHPAGFDESMVLGTDGTRQAGQGYLSATDSYHALLWSGSAASVVDLHPAGFTTSALNATAATQQVGVAYGPTTGDANHAQLWNGTAASRVDLNPPGFLGSFAYDTDGVRQVGAGLPASSAMTADYHALLWNGTAASYVDLHPDQFKETYAHATSGTQQVGRGYGPATLFQSHALLWTGTAASVVDLNPAGFSYSEARDTNGVLQVGYGINDAAGAFHALLWDGTSAGSIDLHAVLPATLVESFAFSISGSTVYGYAIDTDGNHHAIAWTVPEPAGLAALAVGGVGLVRRRRV